MDGVWIGTSGWSYKGWAETFYPREIPRSRELEFYLQHFPTVEINNTFYRLPLPGMVEGWRKKVPDDFLFAVKGSRFITHMKKLRGVEDGLKLFFERTRKLGTVLGAFLWQLPPNLHKDTERLGQFLELLPSSARHAVEFRHPSWVDETVFRLLREHNVAHAWVSSKAMPMDFTVTADFLYLRFHGLEGGAAHDYTGAEMKPWAERLLAAAQQGIPALVYFNNDLNTRAPANARALARLIGPHAINAPQPHVPTFDRRHIQPRRAFTGPRSKRLRGDG